MTGGPASWHTITEAEVDRLGPAIESAVEMLSDYGRQRPDWDRVVDEVEQSEDELDLGTDMTSPPVRAILRRARKLYHEMQEGL